MARAGLRSFGHTSVQFMMVWQRYSLKAAQCVMYRAVQFRDGIQCAIKRLARVVRQTDCQPRLLQKPDGAFEVALFGR